MSPADKQSRPERPLRVGDRVAFTHNDSPEKGRILVIYMKHNSDPLLEITNGERCFLRLASEVKRV